MNDQEKLHFMSGDFGYFVGVTRVLQFFWFMVLNIPDLTIIFLKKFFPGKGKSVAGKNVLITGAARGLGRAMAFEFAKRGSRIICVDVDGPANEKTAEDINEMAGDPGAAKPYVCDVGDSEAVKKLAGDVHEDYERVDILVSNAGLLYGGTVLDEDEDMARRVVAVNQMSNYWMVRNFLPKMKERNEGHLVFINSIASLTPLGDAAMYTITKYALLGLTATLADEFSRDPGCSNIKISSVHPGFIATDGIRAQPLCSRLLLMRVEEAAAKIVRGVRREYYCFTVPGYETGFWILSLCRIIPLKVYNKLVQSVYDQILLPEKSSRREISLRPRSATTSTPKNRQS